MLTHAAPEHWDLGRYAARHFAPIADRKQREHAAEVDMTHAYFGRRVEGFFIEVGANEPKRFSQTWALEQAGWRGLLVEPTPALCDRLRAQRPQSTVIEAACSSPARVGAARFHVASNSLHSALTATNVDFAPTVVEVIEVQVRTLDQILAEAGNPRVDLLSIDVEGAQLDVLHGIDLARHRPALVLLEDHLADLHTHRHMTGQGYRLVKRTGLNNWYIPAGEPFTMTRAAERFRLWRKLWLRTWFRALRAGVRRRVIHRA